MATLPARSTGFEMVHYLRIPITFTSLGTAGIIPVGTLPNGAIFVRGYAVVTTVFNFGTNNLCKVGTVAADTTFSGATLSLATLGLTAFVPLGAAAVAPTADTGVIVTSLCTGTAATTGAGFIVLEYLPVA